MNFETRSYYLMNFETEDHNTIPPMLKRYFHCKIRCKAYGYQGQYYWHLVSVNKKRAKHVEAYLGDNKIEYVKLDKNPTGKICNVIFWEEEPAQADIDLPDVTVLDDKFEQFQAELKKHQYDMLNFMTEATDMNITNITVYGGDGKTGDLRRIDTSNPLLIQKFKDFCFTTLKENTL